ncbi:MAG: hypothetical protein V4622_11175 [Bacteroidota bacterium]
MKTIAFISIIILSFTTQLFSQNVITVRNKHSKVLIHTMKENEFLARGESKIMVKTNGADYEFILQESNSRGFTTYRNGKNLGKFPDMHYSDDKTWLSYEMKGDKKMYTLNYKSGKKVGPYDYISSIINSSNTDNLDYRYELDNKTYIYVNEQKKTFGPYDNVSIHEFSKNNINFSFSQNSQWFYYENGKITGPFKDIRVPYFSNKAQDFFYTYRNMNNEWKVFYKKELDLSFQSNPDVTILDNGKIMVKGTEFNSNDYQSYAFIDDKKYPYQSYKNEVYTNSFGDVLTVKIGQNLSYENQIDSIFSENKYIGSFRTSYMYRANCKNSDYFKVFFIEQSSNENKKVFIYKKNGEFVNVGTKNEINESEFYLAGDDYYYIRNSDKTLIKNGKETEHKDVFYLNYEKYPEEVIMGKTLGKYDVFYRNGKEMTYEEVKKLNLYIDWRNIKGKDYTYETINEKLYAVPKNSSKKFGPVKKYNPLVFSKNNEHYGECDERQMQVFIDGKLFSSGFSLTYNPNNNAFYWMSMDKNKLYLHTYFN